MQLSIQDQINARLLLKKKTSSSFSLHAPQAALLIILDSEFSLRGP